MADTDLLFKIKGDSASAVRAFEETAAAAKISTAQIKSQTTSTATEFQKQFGYLPVIQRQERAVIDSAQREKTAVVQATQDKIAAHQREATARQTLIAEINAATKRQASETSILIGASVRDIAGFERAAVGAENALAKTTASVQTATAEATGFGATVGSLAGPIGIGIAVTAGLGLAVVGLGEKLFELDRGFAETGRNLLIMSRETGLTTEELSGLRVGAEKVGISLESLQPSFGIFLKNLSEAEHGSNKQEEAFRRIGFSAQDLAEGVKSPSTAIDLLLQKLAAIPSPAERMDAAMLVAGRGARKLAEIAVDAKGSLAELQKQAEELGVSFSRDDVEASKKFTDELTVLKFKVEGFGNSIARGTLPAIQHGLDDISTALGKNKSGWDDWGQYVGLAIETAILELKLFKDAAEFDPVKFAIDFEESVARARRPVEAGGDFGTNPLGLSSNLGDKESKERKRRHEKTPDERGQEFLDQLAEQSKLVFALSEESRVKIQLERKEYDGLNETLKQNIIIKAQELDTRKHALDFQKKEEQAVEQTRQFLERQNEQLKEFREGAATAMDAVDKFLESLRREGLEPDNPTLVGILRLKAVMIDVATWAKEDAAAIDNLHERFAALGPQLVLTAEQLERIKSGNFLTAKDLSDLGAPPPLPGGAIDIWKEWGETVSKAFGLGKTQSETFARAFSAVAGQVAQGVGAMVRAFVLFGNSGGSFRKFAAEVIASVAEMAVVQAVFELAQGLAMLALSYFTGNPKYAASASEHFLAAAVFGAIGGVAAIAGRVVAGNAFQEQGAGSTATGSSTGTTQTTPPPVVRTEDRNPQHLIVEVRSKDSHILNVFEKDVQNNGRTRGLIIQTAGAT